MNDHLTPLDAAIAASPDGKISTEQALLLLTATLEAAEGKMIAECERRCEGQSEAACEAIRRATAEAIQELSQMMAIHRQEVIRKGKG